mmetsp:Transcript_21480/g.21253  ORF Transcript_21480/g.21253 Transcript_21480/m.21253 type:complete len:258 (+) Transcript_21480:229-1002(+)
MYIIILKLPIIFASISPKEKASAMLFSIDIISFISSSIRPSFHSFSMLLIILPLALILSSVSMHINSIPIGFVIFSVTFIYISISMCKSSFPICFIKHPVPFIFRAVRPHLDPIAMSLFIIISFACINCSIFNLCRAMLCCGSFIVRRERRAEVSKLKLGSSCFIIGVIWDIAIRNQADFGSCYWDALDIVLHETSKEGRLGFGGCFLVSSLHFDLIRLQGFVNFFCLFPITITSKHTLKFYEIYYAYRTMRLISCD